eukprot:Awhi_evm2s11054
MTLENIELTLKVLRRFAERNVQLNVEVVFLGREVSNLGSGIGEQALECLRKMKTPTTKSEVRGLNQSCSWWSRYIPRLSIVREPTSQLTKKGVRFRWGDEQDKALKAWLEDLEKSRILASPDYEGEMVLFTDGSLKGEGATLFNKTEHGLVPVGFASSKLLPVQKDYRPTNLEALGLTFGIMKFEKYLSVVNKPVQGKTDYKPLLSIWEEIPEKESVRYRCSLLLLSNKPVQGKTDYKPLLSIWEEIPEKESVRYRCSLLLLSTVFRKLAWTLGIACDLWRREMSRALDLFCAMVGEPSEACI